MEVPHYSLFKRPDPLSYFKLDGLDEAGLAKVDKQIKDAKNNLDIADNLQSIRNVLREGAKSDLTRKLSSDHLRYSILDIKI